MHFSSSQCKIPILIHAQEKLDKVCLLFSWTVGSHQVVFSPNQASSSILTDHKACTDLGDRWHSRLPIKVELTLDR